ncbi:MAG: glutaredoxin domain-containing protein [Arthrobacter sp.]
MKVTVWTKSDCSQCVMTKKLMARKGIDFEEADLESDAEQLAKFKEEGLLQAPIIVLGRDGRRWSGFRPDLIEELSHLVGPE